jgi:hypothetical protein
MRDVNTVETERTRVPEGKEGKENPEGYLSEFESSDIYLPFYWRDGIISLIFFPRSWTHTNPYTL